MSVASGFVYLDGKIRRVAAFSGTTALINTIGIYATQPTAPQITYFNGDTDFQYNDFAAEVKLNYDNVNSDDCIIAICDNSHYTFPGLRTFFKHYCLVNNGTVDHFGTVSIDNADITSLAINGNNINDIFLPLVGGTITNGSDYSIQILPNKLSLIHSEGHADLYLLPISRGLGISAAEVTIDNDLTVAGDIEGGSFIKTGGTSTQFLKADGSIDETSYATTADLRDYLPLAGGTLTGNLKCNVNLSVDGNITLLGNENISTNLTVQGTCNFRNILVADIQSSGSITAVVDITMSGDLIASSATIRNSLTAGDLTINGAAEISGTLDVGGAFTTSSTASVGGSLNVGGALTTASTADIGNHMTVTGNITASGNITAVGNVEASAIIKTGGTSAQFLKADGSVDTNTYATTDAMAAAVGNYLPLLGGTLSGDLTCLTKITAASFWIPNQSGFIKADGSVVDSIGTAQIANGAITTAKIDDGAITASKLASGLLSGYASASSLNNYLPLSGGTVSGNLAVTGTLSVPQISCNEQIQATSLSVAGSNIGIATAYSLVATLVQSDSFVKKNGESYQFLKADGSVDSTSYATSASLSDYLQKSGGAITGNLSVSGTLSAPQISCNEQIQCTSIICAGSNIGIASAYSLVADVVSSKSFIANGSAGTTTTVYVTYGSSTVELTFVCGILTAVASS